MKYFTILVLLLIAVSCKEQTQQPASPGGEQVKISESKQCYAWFTQKDSVQLEIIINNNGLTGNLIYNLFEKDKNSGTITGAMRGDTLIATYKFLSEGKLSSRQVVFLKKGKHLIEGYGEVKEVDSSFIFKDVSSLNFTGSIILTSLDCDNESLIPDH